MRIKLLILSTLLSIGCFGQPLKLLLQKKAAAVSNKEARVNFSNSALSVATYNNLTGDPHTAVRSMSLLDIAGASTGWSITTVATTSTWGGFSGGSSSNTLCSGTTGMSYLTGANSNVWASCFYSYGVDYNVSFPQFRITGLDAGKTYNLWIACSDGTNGFDADPTLIRVVGSATSSTTSHNGNNGATDVTTGGTFTSIAPNGSGEIAIYINKSGVSSEYIVCNAIIIKEN